MNPVQFWKTAMNQEARILLHLDVEDKGETGEIFTTPMGGDVDLYRQFIEKNVFDVTSLDI